MPLTRPPSMRMRVRLERLYRDVLRRAWSREKSCLLHQNCGRYKECAEMYIQHEVKVQTQAWARAGTVESLLHVMKMNLGLPT